MAPRIAGDRLIYANSDVSAYAAARDAAAEQQAHIRWRNGSFVHPPGSVLTQKNRAYTVFTPFHRTWLARAIDPQPTPGVARVEAPRGAPRDGFTIECG